MSNRAIGTVPPHTNTRQVRGHIGFVSARNHLRRRHPQRRRTNTAPPRTSSYTVHPDINSVTALTNQYLAANAAPNGAFQSLDNALAHAHYCEFINKVNIELGQGNLTTTQAADLTYWARILDPTC